MGIVDREPMPAGGYAEFWRPVRESIKASSPELLIGRHEPRGRWLVMNSPIEEKNSYIQSEIGSGELRVMLEIAWATREENLRILQTLEGFRAELESQLGRLEFDRGSHRCKVVRRIEWKGDLLSQPEKHDEAREWFRSGLIDFRRAFEEIADAYGAAAG